MAKAAGPTTSLKSWLRRRAALRLRATRRDYSESNGRPEARSAASHRAKHILGLMSALFKLWLLPAAATQQARQLPQIKGPVQALGLLLAGAVEKSFWGDL